jgi:WD40 repeat protein
LDAISVGSETNLLFRNGDVTTVKAHASAVRSVNFSPDEESFVTASDDKSVKVPLKERINGRFGQLTELNSNTPLQAMSIG